MIIRILKEMVLVLFSGVVAVGISLYVMRSIARRQQYDVLTGSIVKKQLEVNSPVFGTLEQFSLSEGKRVKKGDVLGVIRIISTEKELPKLDSALFAQDKDRLRVINPNDAIVAQKVLAESSTLKPLNTFLVLYPLSGVQVKVFLPKDDELSRYSSFVVVDSANKEYPLVFTNTQPVDRTQEGDEKIYFASFEQIEDSLLFYNNQEITIRAKKQLHGIGADILMQATAITDAVDQFVGGLVVRK